MTTELMSKMEALEAQLDSLRQLASDGEDAAYARFCRTGPLGRFLRLESSPTVEVRGFELGREWAEYRFGLAKDYDSDPAMAEFAPAERDTARRLAAADYPDSPHGFAALHHMYQIAYPGAQGLHREEIALMIGLSDLNLDDAERDEVLRNLDEEFTQGFHDGVVDGCMEFDDENDDEDDEK